MLWCLKVVPWQLLMRMMLFTTPPMTMNLIQLLMKKVAQTQKVKIVKMTQKWKLRTVHFYPQSSVSKERKNIKNKQPSLFLHVLLLKEPHVSTDPKLDSACPAAMMAFPCAEPGILAHYWKISDSMK